MSIDTPDKLVLPMHAGVHYLRPDGNTYPFDGETVEESPNTEEFTNSGGIYRTLPFGLLNRSYYTYQYQDAHDPDGIALTFDMNGCKLLERIVENDSGEVSYREVKRLVEKEIEYDSYDSFGDYDPEYGDTQFFIPGVEDLDENTALRDAILAGEACWLRSLSEMPEDEAEIAEWRHTFLSQDGGTVSETDMKETMPTRFYFIMN